MLSNNVLLAFFFFLRQGAGAWQKMLVLLPLPTPTSISCCIKHVLRAWSWLVPVH